ncbi:hypothetical protein LCGC14_0677280 [marine sediment metagenome]|uniref:Uncharacterized protein n=1 Tax=marine sediment metagenome TaxID=412755 RepID=A0A0F9QUB5_9ZZZZ
MTCDKCTNIHDAQKEGKTQDECKCTCHGSTVTPLTNPWYDPCCPTIPWYDPCCPAYPPPFCPPTITCGCCPCTDPANIGKSLGLVCNCQCHGTTFCGGIQVQDCNAGAQPTALAVNLINNAGAANQCYYDFNYVMINNAGANGNA